MHAGLQSYQRQKRKPQAAKLRVNKSDTSRGTSIGVLTTKRENNLYNSEYVDWQKFRRTVKKIHGR